jgi:hypothetical protein
MLKHCALLLLAGFCLPARAVGGVKNQSEFCAVWSKRHNHSAHGWIKSTRMAKGARQ